MNINTLVNDIYSLIQSKGGWDAVRFDNLQLSLQRSLRNSGAPRTTLRLSGLGPKCPCALWHSVHRPDLAEPLPAHAQFKYTYGHIIEALVIELAKAAGHDVQGEQDEIILDGVVGHRDCVIDGAIVDVKSTSTMGFKKFRDKTIAQSDDFGYLDQLDAYVVGSVMANDPLVTIKDRGYLLAVDKQLGHMCLYEHRVTEQRHNGIRDRIRQCKDIVGLHQPPICTCKSVADGKSGNYRLDVKASYSPFKFCCNPQLRTFLYSDGPRYLTKTVRLPDVPEITIDNTLINV